MWNLREREKHSREEERWERWERERQRQKEREGKRKRGKEGGRERKLLYLLLHTKNGQSKPAWAKPKSGVPNSITVAHIGCGSNHINCLPMGIRSWTGSIAAGIPSSTSVLAVDFTSGVLLCYTLMPIPNAKTDFSRCVWYWTNKADLQIDIWEV